MAEERPQEQKQSEPVVVPKKKKKKKLGKITFLFWLILLALGTATGMHLSGIWDGRPLFWSIVPKIPYVGQQLAEFFQVPEYYALTSQERRAVELEQWQRRLDAIERSLDSQDVDRIAEYERRELALVELSRDVSRARRKLKAEQAEQTTSQASDAPNETEQELMNQVARTYQDMSARNAAAIIEQLRDNLAVELIMKLPNDARSSIMGKLKPAKAARITELMTRRNQN